MIGMTPVIYQIICLSTDITPSESKIRITDSSDTRITDDGDTRITDN
jgi:hypothetical protein